MPTVNMIHKLFNSKIKATNKDRVLEFTITTETQDRDGEVVKAEGGLFDNYVKNPVVLWAHDYQSLPVGKSISIMKKGKNTVSEVEFPTKEEYEYADTVYKLCKAGYLNTVSIGFIPIEVEKGKGEKEPSRIYTKWELLEFSIVPVPSNPDALVTARDAGLITVKEFEAVTKSMDFDNELNKTQLQEAFWQYMDTLAMCVSKTMCDRGDANKPVTMTAHGDAFYACYGKWVKDCKKAGMFDDIAADNGPIMMSYREHLKAEVPVEKKPNQGELKDELDYALSMIQKAGISEGNKDKAIELANEIRRITGSDIPVKIDQPIELKVEDVTAYLNSEVFTQIISQKISEVI